MSFKSQQKDTLSSFIIQAKSLLSKGDETGAFTVLKIGAWNGDVMACYDCGFMMIQGIGCEKDCFGGMDLMCKWMKLKKGQGGMNWKSDGSVSELFEPQTMKLCGLFIYL